MFHADPSLASKNYFSINLKCTRLKVQVLLKVMFCVLISEWLIKLSITRFMQSQESLTMADLKGSWSCLPDVSVYHHSRSFWLLLYPLVPISSSHVSSVKYLISVCVCPQLWPDPTTTSCCDRSTPPSPQRCHSSRSSCWPSPSAKPPPSGTTSADWRHSRSERADEDRWKRKNGGVGEWRKKRAVCSCLKKPFSFFLSFLSHS